MKLKLFIPFTNEELEIHIGYVDLTIDKITSTKTKSVVSPTEEIRPKTIVDTAEFDVPVASQVKGKKMEYAYCSNAVCENSRTQLKKEFMVSKRGMWFCSEECRDAVDIKTI